jgi:hypothetical protein
MNADKILAKAPNGNYILRMHSWDDAILITPAELDRLRNLANAMLDEGGE